MLSVRTPQPRQRTRAVSRKSAYRKPVATHRARSPSRSPPHSSLVSAAERLRPSCRPQPDADRHPERRQPTSATRPARTRGSTRRRCAQSTKADDDGERPPRAHPRPWPLRHGCSGREAASRRSSAALPPTARSSSPTRTASCSARARVDVGSPFATTLSIKDHDFMAGRWHFYNEGNAGSVVNKAGSEKGVEGHIVTANGYTALSARRCATTA